MKPFTDLDRETVRRGHRMLVTVDLWHPSGKVGELPITSGDVQFSLTTADGMRSGRLTVPDLDWFDAVSAPQAWVNITVTIEKGTWSLGQFPILQTIGTRPGGTMQVTLGDWAFRRHQPQGRNHATIGATNQTVAACVAQYMSHVLPPVTCTRDDSGGALVVAPITFRRGESVWAALTDICNAVSCVPVMTSRQTVEVRNFTAVAAMDDLSGTVTKETVGILTDKAVNEVIMVLESSDLNVASPPDLPLPLTTGPYKFDAQGFGVFTIVETERTPVATAAMQRSLGQRIYDRRVGLVRSADIEVIPMPWLEAGDSVTWDSSFLSDPMTGRIETITFPLTPDGIQRIALRDGLIR